MTDETRGAGPNEERTPPEDHDEAAMLEGAGDFTSGEGLVAFAGMVLLAVWVIFQVILGEYSMNPLVPVLAAVAVMLPRLDRTTVEKVLPLPLLMKLTAWAIVLIGMVAVILDVRFNVYEGFASVIGAIGAYAGYAMAFVGARQIST